MWPALVGERGKSMPSGRVEKAIRGAVGTGQRLATPAQGAPFTVESMDGDGVVLAFGPKKTRLRQARGPKRCDECGSYEVRAGVCRHCEWVDPSHEPPGDKSCRRKSWSGGWQSLVLPVPTSRLSSDRMTFDVSASVSRKSGLRQRCRSECEKGL
jgi:hypothetical protein